MQTWLSDTYIGCKLIHVPSIRKSSLSFYVLSMLQLMHVASIREVNSFFLTCHLKLSSKGRCRSLEDSMDQRYAPRYLTVFSISYCQVARYINFLGSTLCLQNWKNHLCSGQTISNLKHWNYNLLKPPTAEWGQVCTA